MKSRKPAPENRKGRFLPSLSRKEKLSLAAMLLFFIAFIASEWVIFPETAKNGRDGLPYLAFTRFSAGGIFLSLLCYLEFPVLDPRRLPSFGHLLAALPGLLVAVNNFPILALAFGEATVDADPAELLWLALACLAIGFFEETAFRGVIFPTVLRRRLQKPRFSPQLEVFLSVAITSAIFGAVHLFNLLEGASLLSVLLQIGYSFLIGGMCAILLIKTRSIWLPVLVHAVFDFGGYLIPMLGSGRIWNLPTVLLTVLLSVAALVYFVFLLLHTPKNDIVSILSPEAKEPADP